MLPEIGQIYSIFEEDFSNENTSTESNVITTYHPSDKNADQTEINSGLPKINAGQTEMNDGSTEMNAGKLK